MGEGFQFIDLIFFAMVAVFLILRLRSVLGRRTGNERPTPGPVPDETVREAPRRDRDNVIDLPTRRPPPHAVPDEGVETVESPLGIGLSSIQNADPTFTPADFLLGAQAAFEVIVAAFAGGDKATLRPLLNDDVFANFSKAIDARAEAGETAETQLVGTPLAEIAEAEMRGRTAVVTVRFTSEQVNVVRGTDGAVIDGDPNRIAKVVDVWSFARDTRNRDPNWSLVETRSVE